MNSNICNICGANYEYKDGKWVCPACGAYKVEELSNEEVTLLYNAAQKLRLNAFDDAEEMYRDVVRKYPKNSEGYWGLVLAKYGIKYEQDYDDKMIPTCYATSYESVLNDKNFNRALELATNDNRNYYESQAQKIEAIRKEWIEKASHEPPYDIFISYKDTELDNGVDRTQDSYEAFELYSHLTSLGYRVFYSRESLKGKEGEKYEPYIFNALNTAQVMIIYGTKIDYIESTWIKNEWSRYYKRISAKQKQPNSLVVVYSGFNPSQLPRPLPSVQSLDRGSLTFSNDLDAYVARVIKAARDVLPHIERKEAKARKVKKSAIAKLDTVETVEIKGAVAGQVERETVHKREIGIYSVPKLTEQAEKLLNIAETYLHAGNFEDAEEKYDAILLNDRQNGRALLGKLFAQTKSRNIDEFKAAGIVGFNNLQLLNDVLAYTEKNIAEEILAATCKEVNRRFDNKNYSDAKELYEQICSVDNADVQKLRESLYQKSLSLLGSGSGVIYFIDTALLYEQDSDLYIDKLRATFESCIKAQDFLLAKKYHKQLLEGDATSLQTQLGQLKLDFEVVNYSDIFTYCEKHNQFSAIESVLNKVDETSAKKLLLEFGQQCLACISSGNYKAALSWFDIFSKYQFEEREELLNNIAELSIKLSCGELFDRASKALSQGDAEKYADFCYEFAESARKNGLFALAGSYYNKAIEYGEDDIPYYIGKFYAEIEYNSAKSLAECLVNLNKTNTLELLLAEYESDSKRMEFLSILITAHLKNVRPQAQEKIFSVFETLLAYIPKEYNDKLLSFVNEMARLCLASGLFEKAERYFAMSVGLNAEDHLTYWGLLKAKLKCKTDDDLIKQPEVISEFQEFQNALISVGMNNAAMSHYIAIQNKQAAWIEEQARKQAKKKKQKKIIKITSIVLAAIIFLSGVITGGVFWYNSENQLKYEAVQGGYAIHSGIFYHNTVSGKFEIPSSYNGQSIVEISSSAFKDFDNVTEFVIPYTVTNIADNAFADCDNLQKITFAQNMARAVNISELTEIGARAFYNCKKLNDFIVPYGVTTIGEEAFCKTAFTELDIPNTVSYIGANAFANCNNLNLIKVGDREEVPAEWNSDWNKNCSAEVEFSLRVTFALNGGTLAQTEQYVIYDKSFTFPVPQRTGYTFDGWYRDAERMTDASGASLSAWSYKNGGSVTARWIANENKIVFNGNGATSGSMVDQIIRTDDSAPLNHNTYSKAGYTFIGWSSCENGDVEYTDGAKYMMGSNSSYTLYAIWAPNENTLNFDGNGATSGSMSAQKIHTDETATLNGNSFVRTGYNFAGWSIIKNGEVVYADRANYTMGTTESYTLYAVWTPINYTISYELNGGTVSGNPTTYNIETETIELKNPTRAGYTFDGWTGTGLTSKTQVVRIIKGSTENRSYTAHWTANINTITFHANSGEGNMPQQQIATDATAKLNNNTFTRRGYDFVGWATSANGAKVYDNAASYTMGAASNYDLYAVWELTKYTIKYELDGGTASGNPDTFTIESKEIELKNPTRAGYTFAGWTGDGLNGLQMHVTIESGSVGSRTYTAHWTANINTIIFHANGGEGEMQNQKLATDATDILSQCKFTRKGYSFVGWSTMPNGAKVYDDAARYIMGTESEYNLYAVWQIENYTITYYLDGGSATGNPQSYNVNTAEFELHNPTRRGYNFTGWSGTDIDGKSMSVKVESGNIGPRTYTAHWEIIEYTITYKYNGGSEEDNVTTYTVEDNDIHVKNPSRTGYNFIGWSGTGIVGTTDHLVISKGSIDNRTYEAVFEAKQYTITFKPNGGKCDVSKMTVTYDEDVVLPEVSRFAYDFLGWYNGDTKYEGGIWKSDDGDLTLTAQWQRQEIIRLYTAEDLAQVVYELSANYILESDIDLQNAEWHIIGDQSNPFTGTFDGNHHTVSNFTISQTADYIGFFGANSGTIKNLRITGANITSGTLGAGILVGYNTGRIEECAIEGTVDCSAQYIGGMIGRAEGTTYVGKCQLVIDVKGSGLSSVYVGGIIGYGTTNDGNIATVEQCTVTGLISGFARKGNSTSVYAGGVLGYGYGNISNSNFIGEIIVDVYSYASSSSVKSGYSRAYVGGMVGHSINTHIENSFAAITFNGSVDATGVSYSMGSGLSINSVLLAGGILGAGSGDLNNCFGRIQNNISVTVSYNHSYYSATLNKTENFGGLCGTNDNITVTNCYRPSDDGSTVTAGTPTTATNFKSPNFIKDVLGWDDTIWLLENGEYPKLNLYDWEEE